MSSRAPRAVVRAQDRLIQLLGNTPEGRTPLVSAMLRRDASEATSYWLQLVVSIGIATLGLVVGSTAVVIGAMLVAPLMGPIIGLAMGLAAGSPFLVLRSAGRIGLSVGVAVVGAALITVLLPFHELNAEISARTSPTVLDLITAGFCALAGVYASVRPDSSTTTTAAGTSIGISLVPPLCACGYGFGTQAWPIAGGAALLFLTNLVAIVVVGTVSFVAAGFNRVSVVALERDELSQDVEESRIARALARRLSSVFESRWGPVMRFLMPFLLLAAVYVPLRQALDEVAWQVRVRAAVRASLAQEPLRVVQSRVRVERREVDVVVVVLGKAADAERSRARMDAEIRQASGVTPRLEILAVPDANAIAGLESTLLKPQQVIPPTVTVAPPPTPDEQLDASRARVRAALVRLWPTQAAGEPLGVDLDTSDAAPLRVRVLHLGATLGADTLETLRRAATRELGRPVDVVDVAVPQAAVTRELGDLAFVARVAAAVRATASVEAVSVCVVRPAEPARGRRPAAAELALAQALDEVLAVHPRVTTTLGGPWSVTFSTGPCVTAPAPAGAGDAGPGDAATR
jgi:uncharacterized hydrophobic protein (TIGR00271 family)